MVISPSLNFIWVHNPKTGGTSIWEALKYTDDTARYKHRIAELVREDPVHFDMAHMPWWQLRKVIDWKSPYEPFYLGVVRNPWDWIHSHYMWERSAGHPREAEVRRQNFRQWLMGKFGGGHNATKHMAAHTQWWRVSANPWFYQKEIQILKFEELVVGDGWLGIAKRLNIRAGHDLVPWTLPWAKKTGEAGDYKRVYEMNPDLAVFVARLFSEDIALFDYGKSAPGGIVTP